MFVKTLTVSALNSYIKKVLDNDFILNNSSIKGEISNLKIHSSGHVYFSLKDESSKISCIMFRTYAENLTFLPKDGMNVLVKGNVSVYQKDGQYQLYCSDMKLEGQGELHLAFERLKGKLEKEGLFDEKRKKPLPTYPTNIGIVTSPTGAAVRDIINVTTRRNSKINLYIYPSLVQGVNAAKSIANGIKFFNSDNKVDLIIIARGGGSIEELWAFNEEEVAYAIYNSKLPVISGVGHETDFTIADFVSDRRASTPSAAAEIAVPSLNKMLGELGYLKERLDYSIKDALEKRRNSVNMLSKHIKLYSPMNIIINQYNQIDSLNEKLNRSMTSSLSFKKQELSRLSSLLQAHNPLNVLNKGYSIIQDKNSNAVTEVEQLKKEPEVRIILKHGSVKAEIKTIEE